MAEPDEVEDGQPDGEDLAAEWGAMVDDDDDGVDQDATASDWDSMPDDEDGEDWRGRGPDQPFFAWLFLISPHSPYGAHFKGMPKKKPRDLYRQELRYMDRGVTARLEIAWGLARAGRRVGCRRGGWRRLVVAAAARFRTGGHSQICPRIAGKTLHRRVAV